MTSERPLADLTPWIELLVEAGDGHVQDRVLLECVLALGAARAAALWRRDADARLEAQGAARRAQPGGGSRARARWRLSLARGATEVLPSPHEVDALARRALPSESLAGKRIVVADDTLLALGGASDDEGLVDLAASLFLTHVLVREPLDLGDVAPPLPSGRAGRTEPPPEQPPQTTERDTPSRRLQHDVRNVLASLRATQDLLTNFSDGLSPEETRRFCAVVEDECRRAGRMVAGALLGASEPRTGTCDAARGVERVLDLETASCEAAHVRVERLVEPGARGCDVPLPETDWARVVLNLVVNAREALLPRGGGTVWVTLERARSSAGADLLRLAVEDDGPGIPDEACARVVEDGVSLGKGGSGQGLAIVADLARRAGGKLHVGNRVLGGARLEVVLPRAT